MFPFFFFFLRLYISIWLCKFWSPLRTGAVTCHRILFKRDGRKLLKPRSAAFFPENSSTKHASYSRLRKIVGKPRRQHYAENEKSWHPTGMRIRKLPTPIRVSIKRRSPNAFALFSFSHFSERYILYNLHLPTPPPHLPPAIATRNIWTPTTYGHLNLSSTIQWLYYIGHGAWTCSIVITEQSCKLAFIKQSGQTD